MAKCVRALAYLMALFLPIFQCLAKEEFPMKKSNAIVVFETNVGSFKMSLKPDVAPKTCENFVELVKKGYYNGTIFHRVIEKFMIQGGDPTGTGRGGQSIWGKTFADEVVAAVKFDKPYLLAMANAGPNTNGSQFFITTEKTPWLHMKHTIFGEVIEGNDVIKKIEQTKTDGQNRPLESVTIIKAFVEEA